MTKPYNIIEDLGYCPECGAKEDYEAIKAQRDALLEALKLAAEINPYGSVENAAARDAARAAIAKATGEA